MEHNFVKIPGHVVIETLARVVYTYHWSYRINYK